MPVSRPDFNGVEVVPRGKIETACISCASALSADLIAPDKRIWLEDPGKNRHE